MTMQGRELWLLTALAATMPGCGEDPGPAMTFKKLDSLPLEIEVPADAKVTDTPMGAPGSSVAAGEMKLNVATATAAFPADFAAAKHAIESDPNKFKAFTREEEFEGGWHLEYELVGMSDQTPLYGVEIRKTIDEKSYLCGRTDRREAVRDAVVRACQSLKKAE